MNPTELHKKFDIQVRLKHQKQAFSLALKMLAHHMGAPVSSWDPAPDFGFLLTQTLEGGSDGVPATHVGGLNPVPVSASVSPDWPLQAFGE